MAQRACVLVAVLLIGVIGGCAGQRAGGQGGDDPDVRAAANAGDEWRSEGCATPRSPTMVHTAGVTMPIVDDRIQDLINRISPAGEGRFATVYAGLELTPDQGGLIVYRRPSAEFDAYLRAEAGDRCVIVRDAAHSQTELQALADRITNDTAYWRSRGIAINTVGSKHDGSGVEVGTQEISSAQVELPKRYGAAIPIKVVDQGPVVPAIGNYSTAEGAPVAAQALDRQDRVHDLRTGPADRIAQDRGAGRR